MNYQEIYESLLKRGHKTEAAERMAKYHLDGNSIHIPQARWKNFIGRTDLKSFLALEPRYTGRA